MSAEDQAKWMNHQFYSFVKENEKEKLMYFAMIYKQTVLIITAPTDNAKQKTFLGYDWSNRKGNEGIVINTPGGMLYNESDRFAANTLSGMIREAFSSRTINFNELEEYYNYAPLKDMINFKRVDFNKAIKVNVAKSQTIYSKYPQQSLSSDIYEVSIGKRVLNSQLDASGRIPVYSANVQEPFGYIDTLLISDFTKGSVLWGIDGDWATNYIPPETSFYPTDHCGVLRVNSSEVLPYYVYMILGIAGKDYGFSRTFRASIDRIKEVKIPIPPLDIQQKVVDECSKIDKENNTTRMKIEDYRAKIEKLFTDLEVAGGAKTRIKTVAAFVTDRIASENVVVANYITTDNMLQQCEGITEYEGEIPAGTVVAYAKNDILLSNIRPYLKKIWFADKDGGCSADVLVLHVTDSYNPYFLLYQMKRQQFFDYVMEDISGVKMPRGKKPHILNYMIYDLPIADQDKIATEISDYEAEIAKLNIKLKGTYEKKQEVLKKYL